MPLLKFPEFLSKLAIKPLSNFDIIDICTSLKINNFKGVFMRDEPTICNSNDESIILNMDDSEGQGTHWVSLYVKGNNCYYFDSFGFEPPVEVINYCAGKEGYFSTYKIQSREEVICGHYAIYVIYMLNRGISFHDILHELHQINNVTKHRLLANI